MKVAFDEQIFALQAYGGISRMFAELARQFIDDPGLGVDLLPLNAPVINRYLLDDVQLKSHLAVRDSEHEYRSLLRYFSRVQPRLGQDIVHNTFYLPHGLVHYPKAKRIVTIHDMIPERMPETRRRLDFLTLKKHYVRRADHIICVSEATRIDMIDVYGRIDVPISVVHHGVDPMFQPGQPKPPSLPSEYIVFIGNRGGYKDANVLMRAFAELQAEFPSLTLLFIGGGPFTRNERDRLRALAIHDRVQHVALPDHEMPGAYGNAEVCVFPSRFEGFGLPALEAMACGTPTVLANATSLPEVGGNAARYFTAGNPEDLAFQLRSMLTDSQSRRTLTKMGLDRAARFTWRRAAERTLTVYRSTLFD